MDRAEGGAAGAAPRGRGSGSARRCLDRQRQGLRGQPCFRPWGQLRRPQGHLGEGRGVWSRTRRAQARHPGDAPTHRSPSRRRVRTGPWGAAMARGRAQAGAVSPGLLLQPPPPRSPAPAARGRSLPAAVRPWEFRRPPALRLAPPARPPAQRWRLTAPLRSAAERGRRAAPAEIAPRPRPPAARAAVRAPHWLRPPGPALRASPRAALAPHLVSSHNASGRRGGGGEEELERVGEGAVALRRERNADPYARGWRGQA